MFYDLLVAIYFKIFRFRKNELAGTPIKKIIYKEAGASIILIILFILSVSNFLPNQGIKTANAKLSKTTASALILSDFDTNIEEVLVEEFLNPSVITIAKQKPEPGEESIIEKTEVFLGEEEVDNSRSLLTLNDSSDLILKPQNLNLLESDSQTTTQRTETIDYVVQLGDTVSSIASRFGISINTVLWANNLGNYSLIRPGDSLKILPFSGLLYNVKSGDTLSKIATNYKIEIEDIALYNNLETTSALKIGQQLILPGATRIVAAPVRKPASVSPSYTGVSVIKDLVKAPSVQASGEDMLWPTPGKRISQYFSWAHNGLDIADKVGTAIYAAEAGTVELSLTGWNGGYGNTIVINHGNGKKTRYGHFSVLYVKKGDSVEKGEAIGEMGSTGRSTGSHLHFEVIINGARYNPLNYIK